MEQRYRQSTPSPRHQTEGTECILDIEGTVTGQDAEPVTRDAVDGHLADTDDSAERSVLLYAPKSSPLRRQESERRSQPHPSANEAAPSTRDRANHPIRTADHAGFAPDTMVPAKSNHGNRRLGESATKTSVAVILDDAELDSEPTPQDPTQASDQDKAQSTSRPTASRGHAESTPPPALNEAQLEQFNNLMPLVRKIAKGAWATTMTHEDLVAEGAIGLIRAIQRYDATKGASLNTFAHKYIHGYIQRAIRDMDRIVKPPRIETQDYTSYQKALAELQSEGIRPTIEQIAERANMPVKDVERVALLASGKLGVSSLDNTLHGRPNADSIPSQARDYSEQIADVDLVRDLLNSLSERDRKIITMLHGFPPYKETHSQTEVADELGMSQMYVSRLRKKILAALREAIDTQEAQ